MCVKRICRKGGEACRKCQVVQILTAAECITANDLQGRIRQIHAAVFRAECNAFIEHRLRQFRQICRKFHGSQTGAAAKRRHAQLCQRIRQHYIHQTGAALKGIVADRLYGVHVH